MAHIIGVCELGGYWGHVTSVISLLAPFAARGHRCTIIVENLSAVALIEQCGFSLAYIVGPKLPMPAYKSSRKPVNLSEVLLCAGMGAPQILLPAANAWRHLFTLLSPDVIIADYAPTALLAARGLPIKQVAVGSAFCLPPNIAPLPQFNARMVVGREYLLASDQQVLLACNQFLASHNQPALQQVADLFYGTHRQVLTSLPEADGYSSLRIGNKPYIALQSALKLPIPAWNAQAGVKIFAYLKTEFVHLKALLSCLQRSEYNCCMCLSGAGAEEFLQYSAENLRIYTTAVDMRYVAQSARWLIYHAGNGTATEALLAGIGSIVIPIFYEQFMTANALEANGLASVINPAWTEQQVCAQLLKSLADAQLLERCEANKGVYSQLEFNADAFVEACLICPQ